nr:BA14K family protein [Ancylobacter crimeensis]
MIGSVAARPVQTSNWNAHVAWCHNRWRSYRSSDNTFQPNNGPRRQCISPYQ